MDKKFKFLSHTADIKFQAFGESLEKAFENSALALSASIYERKIKNKKEHKIKSEGKDLEALLLNFLEEFLVLFDSENFILSNVKNIKIDSSQEGYKIEAKVSGDDISNYKASEHIKAITYNEMFVKKLNSEKGKWKTQVVLDV